MTATRKQTWAIFCATKVDVRALNLTKEEASETISGLRAGTPIPSRVKAFLDEHRATKVDTRQRKGIDCEAIHKAASDAAYQAAEAAVLAPARVMSGSEEIATIPDVCGFGWVEVKAKSQAARAFVKWAVSNGIMRKNECSPGYRLWVGLFGQSMSKKAAFAHGYASVLCDNGIEAHAYSRMD